MLDMIDSFSFRVTEEEILTHRISEATTAIAEGVKMDTMEVECSHRCNNREAAMHKTDTMAWRTMEHRVMAEALLEVVITTLDRTSTIMVVVWILEVIRVTETALVALAQASSEVWAIKGHLHRSNDR